MADLSFYNYLKAAFRDKLYTPKWKTASFKTKYPGFGYDLTFKQIFIQARKILPTFYTSNFNNDDEGNLEMAKKVLEKLDLKQDKELERKFEGFNIAEDQQAIQEAKEQSEVDGTEQTPAGESAESMRGGAPMPSPSAHSAPPRVRLADKPPTASEEGDKEEKAEQQQPTRSSSSLKEEAPRSFQKAEEPAIKTDPTKQPNFRTSSPFTNFLKNIGSRSQILANRTIGRLGSGLSGLLKGIGKGGISILGGIGGGLGRAGLRGAYGLGSFAAGISRGLGAGLGGFFGNRGFLILFFLAFATFTFIALFSAIGTTPSPGSASSLTDTLLTSDISQCKFTRGGDGANNQIGYKSPLLLSYFQEASNLTGIPPVVLAAFMRVESPATVSFSDDQIRSYQCIRSGPGKNVSSTGALGVMQLQPEGTTGNDRPAIENGAKLIGKKYEELTEADYCDVRKNVIMGAGFILKKLSYKTDKYPTIYGDGTKWDPAWTNDTKVIEKLVNGYYGCLAYGGTNPNSCEGPFNYATDVSTSIQSCQLAPPTSLSTGPTAPITIPDLQPGSDVRQALIDTFGITVDRRFTPDQMRTLWNKFRDVSNTNFNKLVRGTVITAVEGGNSRQTGCNAIDLGVSLTGEILTVVAIHEMGHVIRNCPQPFYDEQLKAYQAEGGVTNYSRTACTYITREHPIPTAWEHESEDYAETITYYLHPQASEQTAACAGRGPNPYANGKKPLHYAVAKKILGAYP